MTLSVGERVRNLNMGPLPGGGPWLILAECPADRHNTLYAAVKGGLRGPGHARCVCPRALWRKQHDLDSRRAEHATWYQNNKERRKAAGVKKVQVAGVVQTKITRDARVPDMTRAACGTPEGRAAVDAVLVRADARNMDLVKALCKTPCPIKAQCLTWVMSAEIRPGAWGGVFGGLTPKERKALAAKQATEQQSGVAA